LKKKTGEKTRYKVGDRVSWDSSGGEAEGKVVRIATRSGKIKNSTYKASQSQPRYIVETDHGTRAAHRGEELRRKKQ
jgi:hypothetical protein